MKPIIIIPKGLMDAESLKMLRDNDLCVVTAKDPAKVRFLDPIPSSVQRGKIDTAAIQLSRILLNGQWSNFSNSTALQRGDFARIYVEMLIKGTALDAQGSIEEQRERDYSRAYREETEKLARADAKAEREAKKKAAAQTEAKA